jgi:EPS-associated MarR family transcriptional regulator
MASRRKEHQEDAKLRVLQIINQNHQITSRKIAMMVGISNGSAHYLITSLIDKGIVKLTHLGESSQKIKYSYLLTPKGIREKSLLSSKFIARKKKEYKALKEEINNLEKCIGIDLSDDE